MIVTVVRGTFAHCPRYGELEWLVDHALGLDERGRIAFSVPWAEIGGAESQFAFALRSVRVVSSGEREAFIPGFVDAHVHAPQYVFAGQGLDLPLLEWLKKYTFPTEATFADLEFARSVYERVVARQVRNGTTTVSYFATIHRPASVELARLCVAAGVRAFVGKVNMDRNAPLSYCETTAESLAETERFIAEVRALGSDLVEPIITPRFVPTCSKVLMDGLGALAATHDVHIQSHVSENVDEIAWVAELHPEASSYTAVYDAAGLLTSKTVLAHGVHLSDSELSLMALRRAGLAHCASSNISLMSGVLDVQRAHAAGVCVGLGTDVAGGPSFSMLDSIRQALVASKTLRVSGAIAAPMSLTDAFYLGTQGGAEALALGDTIGSFAVGKDFDAVHVSFAPVNGPFDLFPRDANHDALEKFLMLGDDRNTRAVWVRGKQIFDNPAAAASAATSADAAAAVTSAFWPWSKAATAAALLAAAVTATVAMTIRRRA